MATGTVPGSTLRDAALWAAPQGEVVWFDRIGTAFSLVRRRPAGRELRLEAAVPRLDHVGGHEADEGVEGLAADRIDHPLADQLGVDAGPRQTLRHDRL